jgi:DNA-binding transcriptional MerR regulator
LQIKSEIESFKSQGVELEEQRKAILKTSDEKQSHAAQKADEFDEKYKEVSKILDQLRAGNVIYQRCYLC